jgi:Carboxypeptidase regulatory-like domain
MKPPGLRLAAMITIMFGLACVQSVRAQEDTAKLSFLVIRDYSGKPVRNASVVMHPVKKNGKQGRGGFELKTDADGKASFEGVPYGPLRVQVLADGFQTFGDDYDIERPAMEITIKMKRPSGQYSVYEDHSNDKDKDKDKKDEKKQPPDPK